MPPFKDDLAETAPWAAPAFAGDAVSASASSGFEDSVWSGGDVSTETDAVMQAPVVAREVEANRLPVALLAGAGVALLGGLVWAGVVFATHLDIGFLAWFVGAATGLAIVRVAGAPVGPAARALAGALAAGGIMVGKYVIFVHEVKDAFGAELAAQGRSIGYLDTAQMSIFVHNLGTIVRPVYALWVGLAFFAAVRTAGGRALFTRRGR